MRASTRPREASGLPGKLELSIGGFRVLWVMWQKHWVLLELQRHPWRKLRLKLNMLSLWEKSTFRAQAVGDRYLRWKMLIWGGGNTVFIILCIFLNFILFYFENKERKGNQCPRMLKQSDYSAEWPSSLGRDNSHLHHKGNGVGRRGSQSRGSHANCTDCPSRVSYK